MSSQDEKIKTENFKKKEAIANNERIAINRINAWLQEVSFLDFYNEISKKVIGQDDGLKYLCSCVYHYFETIAKGRPTKERIMLIAPSGCGKTETYRVIQAYFKEKLDFLPVYQYDCTRLTENGFKGDDSDALTTELFYPNCVNGIGIVFLDELDKKILPSYSGRGENVNEKAQYSILTLLEGCKVSNDNDMSITTTKTLFIGTGAFTEVRERKMNNKPYNLGFIENQKEPEVSIYDGITRDDLIECGGCYELIGRFSAIVNYRKLTDEAVRRVVNLMVKEEMEDYDIVIEVDESFIQKCIEESNSPFGCRNLYSKLHSRIVDQYVNIMTQSSRERVSKIIISEDGDSVEYMTLPEEDDKFVKNYRLAERD